MPTGVHKYIKIPKKIQSLHLGSSMGQCPKVHGYAHRPLAFLVLTDDLPTGCPLHKYVDDTTLSELVQPKQPDTHMSTYLADLDIRTWAAHNGMEVNTSKTKEMLLGPLASINIPLLTISSQTIDRVTSFKLFGVHLDSSLAWSTHINHIMKRQQK